MRGTSVLAVLVLSLITAAAAHATDGWRSLHGPPGGRVLDFASEAGVVYAAVEDRIARSTDGGASWELPTSSAIFPHGEEQTLVERIAVIGGTVVASASNGSVARSTDGGATWEPVFLPVAIRNVADFVADQGRLYAVALDASLGEPSWLLVSHDQGATWAPVTRGIGSFYADGELLLGAGAAEMMRSTDGGTTWEATAHADAGIDLSFVVLRHLTRVGGALFLSATDIGLFGPPKSVIFRSLDNGQTWHRASLPAGTIRIVTGMQAVGGTLLATAVDHGFETAVCWSSQDAGATWQPRGGATPGGDLVFHATPQALLGAAQSRVYRSTDEGFTWPLANDGLPFSWASELAAAGDVVIASSLFTQGLYRFAQGQWSHIQLPGTERPDALDLLVTGGGDAIYAGTEGDGVFRSTDGGLTWAAASAGVPQYNGSAGLQFREIQAMTESSGTVFAGTGPGLEVISGQFVTTAAGIVRSTNGGASWQVVNAGLPVQGHNNFGVPYYDMVLSMAAADGVVYAGMGSTGIFRSANNGASWVQVSTGSAGSVGHLAARDDTVIAITSDGSGQTAARSLDRGETWTDLFSLPGPLTDLAFADGRLLASTRFDPFFGSGVYESTDAGSTWALLGESAGGYPVEAIAAAEGRVYAGTARGGVWAYGGECPADFDGDGAVNSADISAFLTVWLSSIQGGTLGGDFDGDGAVNSTDISAFLTAWLDAVQNGC